jgi:mutator protein MutT
LAGNSHAIVEVAAGLVFRGGKLLIAQRFKEAHVGGLWEFPGGKREPNESFEQCLQRELREELGIDVQVRQLVEEIAHEYPDRRVLLRFYHCAVEKGEPAAFGCAACRWITAAELSQFEFPPADAKLLKTLQNTPDLWK